MVRGSTAFRSRHLAELDGNTPGHVSCRISGFRWWLKFDFLPLRHGNRTLRCEFCLNKLSILDSEMRKLACQENRQLGLYQRVQPCTVWILMNIYGLPMFLETSQRNRSFLISMVSTPGNSQLSGTAHVPHFWCCHFQGSTSYLWKRTIKISPKLKSKDLQFENWSCADFWVAGPSCAKFGAQVLVVKGAPAATSAAAPQTIRWQWRKPRVVCLDLRLKDERIHMRSRAS